MLNSTSAGDTLIALRPDYNPKTHLGDDMYAEYTVSTVGRKFIHIADGWQKVKIDIASGTEVRDFGYIRVFRTPEQHRDHLTRTEALRTIRDAVGPFGPLYIDRLSSEDLARIAAIIEGGQVLEE